MQQLDWQALKPELFKAKIRPLYDSDFWRALSNIPVYPCFDNREIYQMFLEAFDVWVQGSRLNRISGLEAFPVRNVIGGVTHSLDDLHIRYRDKLVILEDEYSYHIGLNPQIRVKRPENLKRGDVLVMGVPFARFGGLHPVTPQILQLCEMLKVPVHVDAALYGCLRDFEFDYSHPAIHSVSFSLSKSMGLGANRIGVRYSREPMPGSVMMLHQNHIAYELNMWNGIHYIKRFGSDWLQTKYGPAYSLVCAEYGLRKANAIHMAFAEVGEKWVPVGLRAFLSAIVEGRNEFEYCRGPQQAPSAQA